MKASVLGECVWMYEINKFSVTGSIILAHTAKINRNRRLKSQRVTLHSQKDELP